LKEQIEKFRDYKEQVVVLRAERDHLENKVKMLSEKVKYLSTPVRKKILFQYYSLETTLGTYFYFREQNSCSYCRTKSQSCSNGTRAGR